MTHVNLPDAGAGCAIVDIEGADAAIHTQAPYNPRRARPAVAPSGAAPNLSS
jgi:hypothetical protein